MSFQKIKNTEQQSVKVAHTIEYPFWLNYALLGGILLITFWCYHYTLNNQFINWDDGTYLYANRAVQDLSPQNWKMLLTDTKSGNFHPITMLSLAVNWYFSGANPKYYYVTEIILHLLNTVLVFFLSLTLFNAMVKRGYGIIKYIHYLAGLCALLHGIHPMHVESVSWISERKDLLYFCFYLLGLLRYVKYLMENRKKQLYLVMILFLLSLLSKPMAIVFPLSLFTIDILLKRKINRTIILEKIPFFFVSLIFSYLTYRFQVGANAITPFLAHSISQRIMFSGYNYIMYIIKLFVPTNLSAWYPYPGINDLPLYFHFAPFAAIGLTIGLLYIAYKNGENYFRVALFGFGFYFFNIMLVLQFISAGFVLMAERYSYASYFGLTFMLVYFMYILIEKIPSLKIPIIIIVCVFSSVLVYLCQERTKVWHSVETFWTDIKEKYPYIAATPYEYLGFYYIEQFQQTNLDSDMNKAYENLLDAIKLGSLKSKAYFYTAMILNKKHDYKSSLDYYSMAIKMDSTSDTLFIYRGYAYSLVGENELSIKDFNHATSLKPKSEYPLSNLAFNYLNIQKFDSAIKYYNRLIEINPANAAYFRYRGAAEFDKGSIKLAMDDFMQNLLISPHDSQCMFFLSKAYDRINDFNNAYKYAQMAQSGQYNVPTDYISYLKNHRSK